jgi:3-oxoacyl-[acyl-carrier protein] reductase
MSERKWVLVTGSSRGIGRAIALRLAQDGYNLVLHGRTVASATLMKAEVEAAGAQTRVLGFDISDRAATEATLMADVKAHGIYYGVICNAGLSRDGAFPALSADDWDVVLRTNLDGFFNVLHPLTMPLVRARKPARIITMASVSGLVGNRGQVNYSAAKAGVIGATKALAIELASRNITVNCVAPGLIETDMTQDLPMDEILKMIPANRVGKPDEVASLVSYLLSDAAAYITRQVIAVNGGLC